MVDVTIHTMLKWILLSLLVGLPLSSGACSKSKNLAYLGNATWSSGSNGDTMHEASRTIDGDASTYTSLQMEIEFTGDLTLRFPTVQKVKKVSVDIKGRNKCNVEVVSDAGTPTNQMAPSVVDWNIDEENRDIAIHLPYQQMTIKYRCIVYEPTSPIVLQVVNYDYLQMVISDTTDCIHKTLILLGSYTCNPAIQHSGSWYLSFDSTQLLNKAILDIHVSQNCMASLFAGLHRNEMVEISSQEIYIGHRIYTFTFEVTAITEMGIKLKCRLPAYKSSDFMLYEVKVHAPSPYMYSKYGGHEVVYPLEPATKRKIPVSSMTSPYVVWLRYARNIPLKVEVDVIQKDETVIPLYGLRDDVISYYYTRWNITIVANLKKLSEIAEYILVRAWEQYYFPNPFYSTNWEHIEQNEITKWISPKQLPDMIVVQVINKKGYVIEGKGYSSTILCEKFLSGVCDVAFGFNDELVKIWFTGSITNGYSYRIQAWNFTSEVKVKELTFTRPAAGVSEFTANENVPSRFDESSFSTFELIYTQTFATPSNLRSYNFGKMITDQNQPEPKILTFQTSPLPKVEFIDRSSPSNLAIYAVIFKQWKTLNKNNYCCEKNSSMAKFAGNESPDFVYTVGMEAPFKCFLYDFERYAIGLCNDNCDWYIRQCSKVAVGCLDDVVATNHSHHIIYHKEVKSVRYWCDKGYKHVTGSLIMFCDEYGRWRGEKPTCEEIKCDEKALNIADANYTITGTSVDDNATSMCKEKYRKVSGDVLRQCQANGSWSGTSLVCDATEERLRDIKQELKEKLLVNRANVTNYRKSKISVYEDYPTVVAVGTVFGIIMLALEFAVIVIPDIPKIYQQFRAYHIHNNSN